MAIFNLEEKTEADRRESNKLHKENKVLEDAAWKWTKAVFNNISQEGVTRLSDNALSSLLHLVCKKNEPYRLCGSYHLCGDCCALNTRPVLDRYPLLHIQDFRIHCFGKSFQHVRLSYSLQSEHISMSDILKNSLLRRLPYCFAYLDDMSEFLQKSQDYEKHWNKVQSRLYTHGVALNEDKCIPCAPVVTFLVYRLLTPEMPFAHYGRPIPDIYNAIQACPH
ncbi:uncharacterized protein LOC126249896 [Schistocerca nitens]|uniref:uncharacterized protein LOC126249896 n=1 Tax=Schistocerca nitens TaxID=7011 RepID=UPI0021186291|nr:uncharacterized protein LOC126249896 [Schistocerca nitens]